MLIKNFMDIGSLYDARTMGIVQQAAKYKSKPTIQASICDDRHLHILTIPNT